MTVFRFGRVCRCGVGVESLFWCVGWWWVVGFLRYGLGMFGCMGIGCVRCVGICCASSRRLFLYV